MKILIVQANQFLNGSGGTEKICSFLANGFIEMQHQVEIATNENIYGKAIFPLHESIKVTNIYDSAIRQKLPVPYFNYEGKNPFLWINHKVKKKYAKFLNKRLHKEMGGQDGLYEFNLKKRSEAWKKHIDFTEPDLIITMSIGTLLEISYQNDYDIPIINSVNGRPDYDYSDILWYRSEIYIYLLKESYKKLSAIQILFDSYKNFLPETFHNKSVTIPNPVPQFDRTQVVNHLNKKERYKIINIASLATDCKQQNVAINVFMKIAHKYPNWDLHFWGSGTDYNLLNNQIKTVDLQDRIFLNGFTDNPLEQLKRSDIFIFPSKYEGFPLALTEAMSVGLPSVGFKTCSGVNELIQDNKNGFLSANETEMVSHLESLIQDNLLRQTLGENAHLAMKKYAPETVLKQWEVFINSLVK